MLGHLQVFGAEQNTGYSDVFARLVPASKPVACYKGEMRVVLFSVAVVVCCQLEYSVKNWAGRNTSALDVVMYRL